MFRRQSDVRSEKDSVLNNVWYCLLKSGKNKNEIGSFVALPKDFSKNIDFFYMSCSLLNYMLIVLIWLH